MNLKLNSNYQTLKALLLTSFFVVGTLFSFAFNTPKTSAEIITSCAPVTYTGGQVVLPGGFNSQGDCKSFLLNDCTTTSTNKSEGCFCTSNSQCASGSCVETPGAGGDKWCSASSSSTHMCYTSWRPELSNGAGGCYSKSFPTSTSCSSTDFPFASCLNSGTTALSSCTATCSALGGCSCPANCVKASTPYSSTCGGSTTSTELPSCCINGKTTTSMTSSECTAFGGVTRACNTTDQDCTLSGCGALQKCDRATSRCVNDPTQVPGSGCTDNSCGAGYYCNKTSNSCKPIDFSAGCTENYQCGVGNSCVNGQCFGNQAKDIGASCTGHHQCASKNCVNGTCQAASTGGTGGTGGTSPTGTLCPDGSGKTIIRSDIYTCPNGDTNGDGQCTSGDANYTVRSENGMYTTAPTGVGECWQIDYYAVDLNGSQSSWGQGGNGGYCGHMGNPENCQKTTTTGSPAPSPSTPPAPMCLNIVMSKPNPVLGDQVTFTCGQVAGVTSYQFRIKVPSGEVQTLAASAAGSNTSQALTVSTAGTYFAQCQVCNANGCSGWETMPTVQ